MGARVKRIRKLSFPVVVPVPLHLPGLMCAGEIARAWDIPASDEDGISLTGPGRAFRIWE